MRPSVNKLNKLINNTSILWAGRSQPLGIPGSSKYGGQGQGSGQMFGTGKLNAHMKKTLATWVNNSKANSTWSTYRTAERMILLCQKQEGIKFDWPMQTDDTLVFIYWLIERRGIKVSSVQSYLAGVRQLHINKGMEPPKIRTDLVKQALKGRLNMERQSNKHDKTRLPMTMALMELLKERTRQSDWDTETKRLLWALSTLMFFGAFRISELVSSQEATFDPDHTLLGGDIKLVNSKGGGGTRSNSQMSEGV